MSLDELDDLVDLSLDDPKFLCHNQFVESAIKDFSAASGYIKESDVLGAILIMNSERNKMGIFKTKKQYIIDKKLIFIDNIFVVIVFFCNPI